ncbi:hypothetical protein PZ938_14005 [Luteipulveratus sp. YIM 133132]|uniref:hypothetical protein n=1 Tax=Luteipulveratus flavus TaxID=3031728 RepID=UPI0023B0C392|nr:hypothetical protein [Luteipulveratus sp. YIM 133132]MDE9366723.1 hypothetical protein [Luteipulveratus sp. YIM 133132]
MLDQGGWRLARAVTFTVAAVALSLTAHLAGGGPAPAGGVLALAGLVTLGVTLLVAGRRVRRPAMLALLCAAQLGLHSIFAALDDPVATSCADVGHHAASCAAHPMAGVQHGGAGLSMLVAHAFATVLLALLLARGEQILWTLAAGLGLTLPARPVGPAPLRRAPFHVFRSPRPRTRLRRLPLRRGPPQVALDF